MARTLLSNYLWVAIAFLMIIWLPLTSLIFLFDRDPTKYRTGKWFRKLGGRIVAVNPSWKVEIIGDQNVDDRKPYVMISNHLSNADIPVISLLNWEMKWISKMELFNIFQFIKNLKNFCRVVKTFVILNQELQKNTSSL